MKKLSPAMVVILLLAGCDSSTNPAQTSIPTLSGPDIHRQYRPENLEQGFALYVRYCAECHGQQAEGNPSWRQRLADGTYPPPPLNGSGHAWHHAREQLRSMINNGSQAPGDGSPVGKMPPWRDVLAATEIDLIIDWFQSLWPDEVYALWYERHVRARGL